MAVAAGVAVGDGAGVAAGLFFAILAFPMLPMPLNSAVSAGPQTGLVALRTAASLATTPPAALATATDACEVFSFPMRMEKGCFTLYSGGTGGGG